MIFRLGCYHVDQSDHIFHTCPRATLQISKYMDALFWLKISVHHTHDSKIDPNRCLSAIAQQQQQQQHGHIISLARGRCGTVTAYQYRSTQEQEQQREFENEFTPFTPDIPRHPPLIFMNGDAEWCSVDTDFFPCHRFPMYHNHDTSHFFTSTTSNYVCIITTSHLMISNNIQVDMWIITWHQMAPFTCIISPFFSHWWGGHVFVEKQVLQDYWLESEAAHPPQRNKKGVEWQ